VHQRLGAPYCLPDGRDRRVPCPRLATSLRHLVSEERRKHSGAVPDCRLGFNADGNAVCRVRAVRSGRDHDEDGASKSAGSLHNVGQKRPSVQAGHRTQADTGAFLIFPQSCQGWGRGFESLRPLQSCFLQTFSTDFQARKKASFRAVLQARLGVDNPERYGKSLSERPSLSGA